MATPAPPRLPAGERLRRAGIAAWSLIGILIVAAICVWLLFKIKVIFPPLVLALLIIYLLNPIVTKLERRGVRRVFGAIGAYVVVLGGITLVVIALIPVVSGAIASFEREWPTFRRDVVSSVQGPARALNSRFGTNLNTAQVACLLGAENDRGVRAPSAAGCDKLTQDFRTWIGHQAGRLTDIAPSVLAALVVFIVAPLIALYLLIDLPKLQRDLVAMLPESHREETVDVASKVGGAVGGFFRGQLLVALIVGTASAIGFKLIGLPFWLVIGAIAGFFNLIPLVGPFIGGSLGFLIGTISGGVGLGLKAALVEVVVQQLDNHVISPNVVGRTVNLHPVTVMLALLAGGTAGGFWGLLLAVPAVAVAKLLLGHFWTTRVLMAEVSPYAGPSARAEPPSVVPETRELETSGAPERRNG
jgi:predicted PurR-regulated permease PerM